MPPILSKAGRTEPPVAEPRPCVLVVDDDDALRAVLVRELRRRGFDAVPAAGGAEAVEAFARLAGRVDLVLMDVNMPGVSGPDALAALRRADPGVRCCFMTADHRPDTRAALLAGGAAAVFGKPFPSAAGLCEALRRLAGGVTRWTS
ncbi:MAG: response regulator [Gemmataceae bacterium]|nr:response regulator [Gemmataceae bacterium]